MQKRLSNDTDSIQQGLSGKMTFIIIIIISKFVNYLLYPFTSYLFYFLIVFIYMYKLHIYYTIRYIAHYFICYTILLHLSNV